MTGRVPKTLVYSSRVSLKGACLHQPDAVFTKKHVEHQLTKESENLLSSNHLEGSIQVDECTTEDLVIEFQLKKKNDEDDDERWVVAVHTELHSITRLVEHLRTWEWALHKLAQVHQNFQQSISRIMLVI